MVSLLDDTYGTKPHIRLWRSVWSCRLPDFLRTGVMGFGDTPKEAYDDWKSRSVRIPVKEKKQ